MAKSTGSRTESKKDWSLTQSAFRRLLEWLDEGKDSAGERYLEMRGRLVAFFDRKNCLAPDELADETLNRVARRLEEEGSIESDSPAHYCYIVARFVFLEYTRAPNTETFQEGSGAPLSNPSLVASRQSDEDSMEKEMRSRCLERCMQALSADQQELIIGYYTGEERVKIDNRRAIAARIGITVNALSIRACRIRDKLEACVRKCLSGE